MPGVQPKGPGDHRAPRFLAWVRLAPGRGRAASPVEASCSTPHELSPRGRGSPDGIRDPGGAGPGALSSPTRHTATKKKVAKPACWVCHRDDPTEVPRRRTARSTSERRRYPGFGGRPSAKGVDLPPEGRGTGKFSWAQTAEHIPLTGK